MSTTDDLLRYGVEVKWEMQDRPDTELRTHGRASGVTRCSMEDRRRSPIKEKGAHYTVTNNPKRLSQHGFSTIVDVTIQFIAPLPLGSMIYVEWTDGPTNSPCRTALIPNGQTIIPNPLPYSAALGTGGIYLTNSLAGTQNCYVLTRGY